jgi:hypothetical protein
MTDEELKQQVDEAIKKDEKLIAAVKKLTAEIESGGMWWP